MKIILNGEPREVSAQTLAALLDECGLPRRVATAVNERFVSADARGTVDLQDGDRVEVLGAMQGG
jgi:sulfur carrier protein